MEPGMIRTENLSKRYGDTQAVRAVSLTLARGFVVVVLGPSGGGKTTLLRLLAGLERPDAGWIEIGGQRVSSPRRMIAPNRRHLGMIFQDLALWPHLTAVGNVAFGLRGRGLSRAVITEKVATALRQVSLYHHGMITGGGIRISSRAEKSNVLRSPGHWLTSRLTC
jgi:ABC-type Fe3+/spermidine/putrescine transport system ATPase subunit